MTGFGDSAKEVGAREFPERCCARCGFLYGQVTPDAKATDRENAIFDPDLLRRRDYPEVLGNLHLKNDQVASQVFTIVAQIQKNSGPGVLLGTRIENVTWHLTLGIFCLRGELPERFPRSPCPQQQVPSDLDQIKAHIWRERSDCPGYFPYHEGFSALQHMALMLEEQTNLRQERLTREVSVMQAKHAARLNSATWALVAATVALGLVTVVSLLVAGG